MHFANLELCKELYELSGWYEDGMDWVHYDTAPAYDLGYLLRKLPSQIEYRDETHDLAVNKYDKSSDWYCNYWSYDDCAFDLEPSDSPEDACAKLAIELIKQNIITPNGGQK